MSGKYVPKVGDAVAIVRETGAPIRGEVTKLTATQCTVSVDGESLARRFSLRDLRQLAWAGWHIYGKPRIMPWTEGHAEHARHAKAVDSLLRLAARVAHYNRGTIEAAPIEHIEAACKAVARVILGDGEVVP